MTIFIDVKELIMQKQNINIKKNDVNNLIAIIKEGLPVTEFETLSLHLGIPECRLVTTVNIDPRTLTRRKKEGRFKPDESERVLRIARLYDRAVEVLGDSSAAQVWFRSSVKGLGNKTPLDFADTELGAKEVENLLGRIEDGVYY
jgi:putative toxin-antitoxin system antitoxin component (TIGR02293 family)